MQTEIYQEENSALSIVKEGCRLRHDGESLQLKRKKHLNLKDDFRS